MAFLYRFKLVYYVLQGLFACLFSALCVAADLSDLIFK